jgi:hypothetical protein
LARPYVDKRQSLLPLLFEYLLLLGLIVFPQAAGLGCILIPLELSPDPLLLLALEAVLFGLGYAWRLTCL